MYVYITAEGGTGVLLFVSSFIYTVLEKTMTLENAIWALSDPENEDKWIRPVKWYGSKQAVCIEGKYLSLVPSLAGGIPWVPKCLDIVAEWEVVDPDDVLEGR